MLFWRLVFRVVKRLVVWRGRSFCNGRFVRLCQACYKLRFGLLGYWSAGVVAYGFVFCKGRRKWSVVV